MRTALTVGMTALALAGAADAYAGDASLTIAGPATLIDHAKAPIEPLLPYGARWGQVLTGWTVSVGSGGQAGTIRPVIALTSGARLLGDPVTLPAEPGTYAFPITPVHGYVTGIDQQTGSHAILGSAACAGADCKVETFAGDPRPAAPTSTAHGESLAIASTEAEDDDGDLVPDAVDRTDLRLSAAAPVLQPDGRRLVRLRLVNAGPRAADIPELDVDGSAAHVWAAPCHAFASGSAGAHDTSPSCYLPALAAGATAELDLLADAGKPRTLRVKASAEGPDLASADNTATVKLTPAKAVTLTAARRQALEDGIVATLTLGRTGSARVEARFTVHGRKLVLARTVKAVAGKATKVTLRATGATLRALRHATPLQGRIVVTGPGSASVTVRVR